MSFECLKWLCILQNAFTLLYLYHIVLKLLYTILTNYFSLKKHSLFPPSGSLYYYCVNTRVWLKEKLASCSLASLSLSLSLSPLCSKSDIKFQNLISCKVHSYIYCGDERERERRRDVNMGEYNCICAVKWRSLWDCSHFSMWNLLL